jgi:hypothetical protein
MADAEAQSIVLKADSAEAQAIVQNEKMSVRQFSPTTWGGFMGDALGFLWPSAPEMLPPWGSYECDVALRVMHYTQQNALWGGAVKIAKQKILGTPYEISGGRNLTFKWQDIFSEADFGEGYDFMLSKFLDDYFTLNRGAFAEIVSYGDPSTPLREGAAILGINHLDALRVVYTGNREFPYLYRSEWGGALHKMHYTRVIHLAESPSPNTLLFGMGKSALYDAMTVANAQILLGRHQNELLNDLPPPGIVIFNNVKPDEVETAMQQFELARRRDGQNVYRAPLALSSKDPNNPATVTFVPMATVPADFDYEKYMRVHVNLLALTLQLDPQDIWPLQSSAMGSGEQSKILEQKSESKGPGYLLTRLERCWNSVIPRSLEWKYKAPNAQADLQIANTAKAWNDIANTASYMNNDEKRQLVADQVPAFADVLMDATGQIRLFDADPKEPNQILVAGDAVQLESTGAPVTDQLTSNSQNDVVTTDIPVGPVATKDIDATMGAYISEIKAVMQDGVARSISQSVFGSRIRGVIVRFGKPAYQDGLEDGGVDPEELDEDDLRLIADYNVWDSTYVTDLGKEVYSEAGMKGTPESRAPLWASTLNRFYYGGLASADKNGMYSFEGDDGEKTCKDCQRLKGQVHRMKDWARKEMRPGVDHHNFECGTFEPNCSHYLKKTTDKARGNW